jgi:gamma-D-glutamyl-L-lysine dipeptidyl-peptidase
MRSSRKSAIGRARSLTHSALLSVKRRSRLPAVLLTVVLTSGSLLTAASDEPAAAEPAAVLTQGPAPGLTLGAAGNGSQPPRLFYADSGGQVWMQDLAAGGSPVSLGGHLVGGPAAVWVPAGSPFSAGAFVVFGRGLDSALWWTYQTATGWSGWASLGGRITSKPTAYATPTSGSSTIAAAMYVRGADGAVWFRALDRVPASLPTWEPWRSLGGRLLPGTSPAAAQASGGVFVAAVGTDKALWVATSPSGGPGSVWHSLGGQTTSDPAVAVPGQSPMIGVAFVRGVDNKAWYNELSGQTAGVTPGWHSLGGQLTSGVTAAPTTAGGPQGLTYLFALGADNQAWMRSGTWPALRGWTPATTAVVAQAPCNTGTCWVAVNVATLWVNPSYPRPVDQPALTNPADPRKWVASMTVAQKQWLVGKVETQALYGTPVTVIGHYGTGWTQVAVPGQPTNRDSRGYPGWVPTRQLTSTAPPTPTTSAVVRSRTAWLWSSWTSAGVAGTRVMEVSYDMRLPVERATPTYVVVSLIGGRRVALQRTAVALHAAGASWGATRANVATEAKKFVGLQYLWGGMSGFGYDCSGFTYSVYHAYGVTLSRDADQQAVHGTSVARASLLPADLVFFRSSAGGTIGHVGMYVSNGNTIDAPHTGAAIRIEPVSTYSYYAGARRYLSQ